jgi:O-antigen ligase
VSTADFRREFTYAPTRRWLALLVPLVLALTVVIARRSGGGVHGASLFEAFAVSLALVSAGYVLLQLPTVYTFGAGLLLSIFSGNWANMGLPGIPDRLLLLASVGLLLARERDQLARFRLTPAHFLLIITVLYAVISAAADGLLGTRLATFSLIDQLGAVPFALFFVVPLIVRTREERQVLLYLLVGLGLYLGLEALLEAIKAYSLVFPRYIVDPSIGTMDGRVRGPFTSAVTEGFALFGCAIASAVFLTLRTGHVAARMAAVLVIPLCLLGCFFTLERGIWIAAVTSIFVVGLLARELRRTVVPTMVVGALLVLGSLAFVPGLQQRAASRSQTKLSVWDRQNQDAAALRMIRARPLFGFGWGTFPTKGLPYFRQASTYPMTGFGIELHDLYLSNAVELGLVGCMLWLLAQLSAFGTVLTTRAPPDLRPWKIGLGALIIFAVVAELFNPLEQTFSELLLWTWAGVILGAAWYHETPTVPAVPRRSPWRPRQLATGRATPSVDPRLAYEPWLRIRLRPRKVALAVVGILAGAGLGVLIAQLTSSTSPSFSQPVTDGIVQVTLPGGWRQASPATGPRLGLTDEFVLRRTGSVRTTLTIGTNVESGGALLPQKFLARARSPVAEIVDSGPLIYYRYRGLTAFGAASSVYALPTSYGTILAVCSTDGSRAAAAAACEQVLSTVSLTAGNAMQPGPDVHYARALDQVITRLNSARLSGDTKLSAARTSGGQARAADALAAAHSRAAGALAHLSSGVGGPANSDLAAALRDTASAYSALGRAAAASDVIGYRQASKAVRAANLGLNAALSQLSRLGYLVG